MNIKIVSVFLVFVVFLILPNISKGAAAANFKFGQASYSITTGNIITVDVIVDTGSEQINAAEGVILYDPTVLEAIEAVPGTFFPANSNDITSGKVTVRGLVENVATSKTGSGIIGSIKFKGLKASTVSLTFDCQANVNGSSKIIKSDFNATNIINCNQNISSTIVVGGGSNQPPLPTSPPPTQLPKTGIFENVTKFAVPGAVLLMIGVVVKLFL